MTVEGTRIRIVMDVDPQYEAEMARVSGALAELAAAYGAAMAGAEPAVERMQAAIAEAAEVDRPGRNYHQPAVGDVVSAIDAAVEGRCAGPGCDEPITSASPSGWWCSADCQTEWTAEQATDPEQVLGRPEPDLDFCCDTARWRPNLVDEPADDDLTLIAETPHPPGTARWYRRPNGSEHLRLDDGHRFVGADIPDGADAFVQAELLGRLERELTDPRRLDAAPTPFTDAYVAMYQRHRVGVAEWEARNPPESPQPAEGTVLWLPDAPADPAGPTAAELEGGVDLTPHLAPGTGAGRDVFAAASDRLTGGSA